MGNYYIFVLILLSVLTALDLNLNSPLTLTLSLFRRSRYCVLVGRGSTGKQLVQASDPKVKMVFILAFG